MSIRRRILILGGARFHGYLAALHLAEEGNEVFVLNRGRYRSEYGAGIKHLIADRSDPDSMKSVLGDLCFDVVIDNNAYNASQVGSFLNLIEKRCEHYVFVSTAAVYLSLTSKGKMTEDEADGKLKGTFSQQVAGYAQNKFLAEEYIRDLDEKLNFTILRPPNIFGEGDFLGKLSYFYRRLRDGGKVLLEREVGRGAEEFIDRGRFNNFTGVHNDHAIAKPGDDAKVMGDEHDTHLFTFLNLF